MINAQLLKTTAIAAVVASLALAGCNKPDQNAADDTVAQVDQNARQGGNEAKGGAQKMGEKVDDAVITASVKTEIAKDPDLSSLKVNVDTDKGRVALRGSAPSTAAKEHATTLVAGIKGVASVDNQLDVSSSQK